MTTWGKRQRWPHEPYNQDSRYLQVYPTGSARKPLVLDRELVGCVLYMNPSPYVFHRNHTEQDYSPHVSSDAEVREGFCIQRPDSPLIFLGQRSSISASSASLRTISSSMEGECWVLGGPESKAIQRIGHIIRTGQICMNSLGAVDELQTM